MRSRNCLLTCCALLFASPVLGPTGAQTASAPDPISGVWTGEMAPRGSSRRQPINVDLRLDGGAVTGTVTGPPHPGTLRSGTYDAATGALRFEVVVGDAGSSVFVFDGMVVRGTALGTVSANGLTGEFKIDKGAGGTARPVAATVPLAALQEGFAEVSDWVTRAAELVPANRYTYSLTPPSS